MAKNSEISERVDRIKTIIEQLDADECSLSEGEELYEEGQRLLTEVRDLRSHGSGDVVEIE